MYPQNGLAGNNAPSMNGIPVGSAFGPMSDSPFGGTVGGQSFQCNCTAGGRGVDDNTVFLLHHHGKHLPAHKIHTAHVDPKDPGPLFRRGFCDRSREINPQVIV